MKTLFYNYPNQVDNKNAGIEIRTESELFDFEMDLLVQAELNKIAEIEAWTALGTNNQLAYSTHGLFRYFGKFPSTIATHLINEYTKENGTVMDPMLGSGTTAVECLLSNRTCNTFDVSPLSVLLAKVKTTFIEENILINELENIKNNYKPMTIEEYDWQPIGLKNLDHWFLETTQNSLRGLLYLINKIENKAVKDFYTICLCSIIRNVSKATSQQGRLFLDVLSAKDDCLESFLKKAEKGIERISKIPNHKDIKIEVHSADAPYENIENDLIIVHPPYFNSYKYSSINSLELSWLKINHADVRKNEVREFFKIGKAEKVGFYVDDMSHVLGNISKTMKVDSIMALMIGDTVIKNQYIPVTKMLLDDFLKNNDSIKVEKVVLRVPKYTEASWTASQRRTSAKLGVTLNDFIVIFRRVK